MAADTDARSHRPGPATDTRSARRRFALLATSGKRLLGGRTVEAVADVFKLLGDPTRVRLVDALTHGERCVCDLATLVGLSESAVSHQLRLLARRASRPRPPRRPAWRSTRSTIITSSASCTTRASTSRRTARERRLLRRLLRRARQRGACATVRCSTTQHAKTLRTVSVLRASRLLLGGRALVAGRRRAALAGFLVAHRAVSCPIRPRRALDAQSRAAFSTSTC